jgi:hypothetical protein
MIIRDGCCRKWSLTNLKCEYYTRFRLLSSGFRNRVAEDGGGMFL